LRRPKTRYQASTVMSIYLPENVADALDEFRRPLGLTRSEAITAILRGFFAEERPSDA
jgi:metal-responsive CopG/Arc/MetJ family transcriptional regulator